MIIHGSFLLTKEQTCFNVYMHGVYTRRGGKQILYLLI